MHLFNREYTTLLGGKKQPSYFNLYWSEMEGGGVELYLTDFYDSC